MAKYLAKRILYLLLALFIVITVTFFMMKMLPGTPFTNQEKLTAAQLTIMKKQYGLDQPVWQQYLTYLSNLLHGDFGTSFQFENQPVISLISSRLQPSLLIGAQALIIGSVLGIILGSLAAIHYNTWVDRLATFISILGISVPSFVLGVILQFYLAFKMKIFPIALWEGWRSSVLPS